MNSSKFNWSKFLKSMAILAIPVALQHLFTTTGSMVDTIMLATLGEKTVGAVGLCAQFSSFFSYTFWGFTGGGALFITQSWGAKDEEVIRKSYGVTICLVLIIGLIFGVLAVGFPEFVLRIYTDKKEFQDIGVRYLRIVGWSYPVVTITTAMSMLLRSTERVRIPLVAGTISVLANCFLNYVFIFGNFGAPAMGVAGAATATVLAAVINLLVLIAFIVALRIPYALELHKCFGWNKKFLLNFFKRCLPLSFNEFAAGFSIMLINVVLGRQSAPAIAAIAIFRTIESLILAFYSGLASGASILVGKAVGAGEHEEAQQNAVRIIYLSSGIISAICLLIMLFHTPLFTKLGLSGESFEICTVLCAYYCFLAFFRLGNWQHHDCFCAGGNPAFGTMLKFSFTYLLVIPCVYSAYFIFHAPFYVVFFFVYCDEPIRYVILQRHLYSRKWIRPVSEKGLASIEAFREKYHVKMENPLMDFITGKLHRFNRKAE